MTTKKLLLLSTTLFVMTSAFCQTRFKEVKENTMEGTKVGIIRADNNLPIISAQYDKILPESDGMFAVIQNQKLGYVDTMGKTIVPLKYLDGTSYNEKRAMVFDGKKWGMINEKGTPVTAFVYDDVVGLSEGVARVVVAQKIGFVNRSGKLIVPCKYAEAYDCTFGLIVAYADYREIWGDVVYKQKKIGQYGNTRRIPIIYNSEGQVIFKGEPDEDIKFTPTGKIIVNRTTTASGFNSISRSKLLDNTGKVIIPYEQNVYLEILDYAMKVTVTDGIKGVGIMDHDGIVLVKPNFSQIDWFTETEHGALAKVYFKNSNDFFYVDTDGKCIEYQGIKCPQ